MKREFFQSHECAGFRAKVTVEWSAPEKFEDMDELDKSRMEKAEEVAGDLLAVMAPKAYAIVQAMRGRAA